MGYLNQTTGQTSRTIKAPVTVFVVCILFLSVASLPLAAQAILPKGSAPPPIVAQYFPDRVHAFVWRNWNLVEPAKMAKLLDTSEQNVVLIAASMGLPDAMPVPPEVKTRGYITILRRNWHLLPYSQLLELVEMTPEQLAFCLREDDFLFHKLGALKPQCEPLRYTTPDETAQRRAAEIKQIVQKDLGENLLRPGEPRFQFLQRFNQGDSGAIASKVQENPTNPSPHATFDGDTPVRFIYSYFALYGDSLSNPELDPYPDGLLQQLSALGVNGVWLHVVLRDLAPGGKHFPEFGVGCEKRLANLRTLVQRAKQHGIGVYLYMNEPRAMPLAFFEKRSAMTSQREGDFKNLCTSNPTVRQWMSDALAHVFHEVPDLAGVFTITASENLTNCASHYSWHVCPRCKDRSEAEILAEVNATIEEGVHRGNPKAKVIAWDWGWRTNELTNDIVARLPKSVQLMSVSEWSLPLNRGGVKTAVGEYSLSAVGPGPRALHNWKAAQAAGLRTVAKVQMNNSWELSTIPYLPVMNLVAEHSHKLASSGVEGLMLSWTLGGYPSPNLEIALRFFDSSPSNPLDKEPSVKAVPSVEEILEAVAIKRYGVEGAPWARKAWTAFSKAFQEYPYDGGGVLYNSPVQVGPANPLYLKPTGYSATMVGIPYDDLTKWRGPYPAEVFATQFEKVADGWRSGIPDLKVAVEKAPADGRNAVQAELRFAQAAANHFQSVANQTRFILARDQLSDTSHTLSTEKKQQLLVEVRNILQSEIDLARQEFLLTREDSRIGFEASNQYVYVPLDLAEKIINCRWLLEQYEN